MRNWKQLGQGLDPARKMGLVSCLCVTALGLPVGMLGGLTSRAQASTRTGSLSTRAAELSSDSQLPSPATDLVPLPNPPLLPQPQSERCREPPKPLSPATRVLPLPNWVP
jgi:hypothetical protein